MFKALRVGALFGISSKNNDGKSVIAQDMVRSFAAVKMAIDQVNNKTDGNYDGLLKNTQVCHKYFVSLSNLMYMVITVKWIG